MSSKRRWAFVCALTLPRIAGAAVLLALFLADISANRAQAGFFDDLINAFGGGQQSAPQSAPIARPRAVAKKKQRHAAADRRFSLSVGDRWATAEQHTICVRLCDGAIFPEAASTAKDPVRRRTSCAKACPETPMRRYTQASATEDVSKARDEIDGGAYGDLMKRLKATESADASGKSCACGALTAEAELIHADDFLADDTLRSGDVVVSSEGLRVFTGERDAHKRRRPAFLSLAQTRELGRDGRLSKEAQGALSAIEKAMQTPRGRN
jgi:hypothetical protein